MDPVHARIHAQILATAIQELRNELGATTNAPIGACCLSAAPRAPEESAPEISDLLRRTNALLGQGCDVLLYREPELYHVTTLVNRYTTAPVRFVAGLSLLIEAFENPSVDQEARNLEAFSRLFAQNVRVYAYPMTVVDLQESRKEFPSAQLEWSETNGWVSAEQMRLAPPLGHLYAYLLSSHFIVPIQIPTGSTASA